MFEEVGCGDPVSSNIGESSSVPKTTGGAEEGGGVASPGLVTSEVPEMI